MDKPDGPEVAARIGGMLIQVHSSPWAVARYYVTINGKEMLTPHGRQRRFSNAQVALTTATNDVLYRAQPKRRPHPCK